MWMFNTKIFRKYLEEDCLYIDGFYRNLSDDEITFLTFDKWKVFYDADPIGWHFSDGCRSDIYPFDCVPYYIYIKDGGNVYKVIKFPTKREYKKFYKFFKNQISHVLDGTENQQEILELSQIIGEKAKRNLEEVQKKVQDQYRKTCELMSNGVVDDIQEHFSKAEKSKPHLRDNMCTNKLPYKVMLTKDSLVYFNDGTEIDPSFIPLHTLDGKYRLLEKDVYHIVQEKFFEGYTYCRIAGKSNMWIKICDIAWKKEI